MAFIKGRRLFEGGVYFKLIISHWEEEERGRACCTGKVLGLTRELRIAKILKREFGGRAAKYGHFDREPAQLETLLNREINLHG